MSSFRIALALVAALGLAGKAAAADLADYTVPPPPPEFSWAGLYVGINGGYGGDRFDYPYSYACCYFSSNPLTGQADLTSSGFVYGAQIGYNFLLTPNWLLGIEADIQGTSIKGELGISNDNIPFEAQAGSRVDWFGTVRGRLGWAEGRFLLYATGGWAYGQTTAYANITQPFSSSISKQLSGNGFTVGGGAEYAITDHITLKTEYLYVDLGKANLVTSGYEDCFTLDQKTQFHVVRAGLNYKF